jgi:hypothetical protein
VLWLWCVAEYARHVLLAFNIKIEEMDTPLCRLALFLDHQFKTAADAGNCFIQLCEKVRLRACKQASGRYRAVSWPWWPLALLSFSNCASPRPHSPLCSSLHACCASVKAAEIYHKRGHDEESCSRLLQQLASYQAGVAPFNMAWGGPGFTARSWWLALASPDRAELPDLAAMLFGITPHGADPERCFSFMRLTSQGARSRLSIEKLGMMVAIKVYHAARIGSHRYKA